MRWCPEDRLLCLSPYTAGLRWPWPNRHSRKRGYTETICVHLRWRRRGLARALLARSLRVLREQGLEEAALSVDAANPSGALRRRSWFPCGIS